MYFVAKLNLSSVFLKVTQYQYYTIEKNNIFMNVNCHYYVYVYSYLFLYFFHYINSLFSNNYSILLFKLNVVCYFIS